MPGPASLRQKITVAGVPPFVEALDRAALAGRERQRRVARLEHHAGWDVDLGAGLDVGRRQLVEADGVEGDAVDLHPTLVALGEVDDHLGLGEHLHRVRHRRDVLDRARVVLLGRSGLGPGQGEHDEHDADGDGQARQQQVAIDPAAASVHPIIMPGGSDGAAGATGLQPSRGSAGDSVLRRGGRPDRRPRPHHARPPMSDDRSDRTRPGAASWAACSADGTGSRAWSRPGRRP